MFAIVNEFGAVEAECASIEGCQRIWRAMIQRGRTPKDIVPILGDVVPRPFDSEAINVFVAMDGGSVAAVAS